MSEETEEKRPEKQRTHNGKLLGGCTGKGFMPGQSGNPKGTPGKRSIAKTIKRLIDEGLDDNDIAEALGKSAIKHALAGDFKYFKEIIDRVDGKVPDQVVGSGKIQVEVRYVEEPFVKASDDDGDVDTD